MSASSNQKSSVSQCSFLCIWSIYYSLEQKVIFIYAQAKNNLFWLKRAISSDSAKMTHPQRETLFTGPWSLTLRKNLKSQKAPFCRLQKQSQRVFINTKNVPWIFSPLKGFLVTCPIPLIVFRSTFRNSELQSLKRLPKAGVYFYSCQN